MITEEVYTRFKEFLIEELDKAPVPHCNFGFMGKPIAARRGSPAIYSVLERNFPVWFAPGMFYHTHRAHASFGERQTVYTIIKGAQSFIVGIPLYELEYGWDLVNETLHKGWLVTADGFREIDPAIESYSRLFEEQPSIEGEEYLTESGFNNRYPGVLK